MEKKKRCHYYRNDEGICWCELNDCIAKPNKEKTDCVCKCKYRYEVSILKVS